MGEEGQKEVWGQGEADEGGVEGVVSGGGGCGRAEEEVEGEEGPGRAGEGGDEVGEDMRGGVSWQAAEETEDG